MQTAMLEPARSSSTRVRDHGHDDVDMLQCQIDTNTTAISFLARFVLFATPRLT